MDLDYYHKLKRFCNEKKVLLVAVSKTKPIEDIKVLYQLGERSLGENKVQELVEKYDLLPKDIDWHFIGHLQKNKVKYIAPFVSLIHSIDSVDLLLEVDKRANSNKRIIKCLLQFHIAKEDSKFGLKKADISKIIETYKSLENVKIIGVMGMATFTDNQEIVSDEFKTLQEIFELIRNEYFKNDTEFSEISMGMSGDYELAIEKGSTMIRIGSSIFGSR